LGWRNGKEEAGHKTGRHHHDAWRQATEDSTVMWFCFSRFDGRNTVWNVYCCCCDGGGCIGLVAVAVVEGDVLFPVETGSTADTLPPSFES
jgi:hypothetical protein